jgi:hypothetical protein
LFVAFILEPEFPSVYLLIKETCFHSLYLITRLFNHSFSIGCNFRILQVLRTFVLVEKSIASGDIGIWFNFETNLNRYSLRENKWLPIQTNCLLRDGHSKSSNLCLCKRLELRIQTWISEVQSLQRVLSSNNATFPLK